MNGTPRVLNRSILLLVGVLAIAVGAAALAAATMPAARSVWQDSGSPLFDRLNALFSDTSVAGGQSWLWLVLLAVLAVLLVAGVLVIVSQGGGRTSLLLEQKGSAEAEDLGATSSRAASGAAGATSVSAAHASTVQTDAVPAGAVLVDAHVAEALLTEAITRDPAVLAVQVTGHDIRGVTAMRISVTLRRGASPARVAKQIETIIANWDQAFGAEIPVMIEITSGIRSRLGREQRVR